MSSYLNLSATVTSANRNGGCRLAGSTNGQNRNQHHICIRLGDDGCIWMLDSPLFRNDGLTVSTVTLLLLMT